MTNFFCPSGAARPIAGLVARQSIGIALLATIVAVRSIAAECLEAGSAAELGLSQGRLDQITEMLEAEVLAGRIAGAVAGIARHGRVGYLQAVGQRDAEHGLPMQRDAIFRIASMTKAFTSAAVMMLVEEGGLSLDDPVSKYIAEFDGARVLKSVEGDDMATVPAHRPPTVRDLLTHTSGLTYGWFGPEKLDAVYRRHEIPDFFVPTSETMADRVQRIARVPLKFQPGGGWDYGVSTDVLGRVVEVVSGLSLQQFFEQRVFQPLKMPDTHFYLPEEKKPRLAALYTIDQEQRLQPVGNTPVAAAFLRFSADYCLGDEGRFYSGGGGLVSTACDYLRFLQMLLNGGELEGVRVLSRESAAQMTQDQIGAMQIAFPGHGDGFGFGFGVLTDRGAANDVASVGTYSWGGIFNTYYWVDPQEQLIGVLMTQLFPYDHLDVREKFKRLTYDAIEGADAVGQRDSKQVRLTESAPDESAAGLDCYKIETPTAVYFLDKVGAGLSSMIDRDGNDWISFHPRQGSGASGEYRGFPNAVFRDHGSYFHPRNAGTDPCVTLVKSVEPDRVVIAALSSNGLWAGRYEFTADACVFSLTKMPPEGKYWVLYEGTPGGEYDDDDWWMTSAHTEKSPLTETHEGDIEGLEWIAFGDPEFKRSLILVHVEDDQRPDRFYQMEQQMTVFGFGRRHMEKHLETTPQSFAIGLVESADHAAVARRAEKVIAQVREQRSQDFASIDLSLDQVARRKALEQFALTAQGDPAAGARLFANEQRTKCATCHRVDEQGGEVGPDLSKIGGKFDRPHLIESLLEPSRQIVEGYRSTVVVTDQGRVYSGVVKSRNQQCMTMLDAENRATEILIDDVVNHLDTDVSIMPEGLADALSPQEFADLIAYLETLRTTDRSFGSGVKGPIQIPPGFEINTVATGLDGATAFEIAPDGRLLVCEQDGSLRVVKDGKLLREPMLSVPVERYWERGLIGVTVSADFPAEPYVYIVYVAGEPHTHHRVSRFRVEGDVAVAGSEEVLLVGDDQRQLGGNVPAGHQGGGIHFGNDGKLYIGIGEQTAGLPAQQLETLQGKILRINPDGSIPADNPLLEETQGKYQAIWALGCRNPFTFAVQKSTGQILINDVGGKFEEINLGVAGANYGWPVVEHGLTDQQGYVGPIHVYPEASISGGDFAENLPGWPAKYQGKYFFADFVHGWIKALNLDDPATAEMFAAGLRRPVDLRFSTDGSLYVLLRNAWVVDDKFEDDTGSLMRIRPAPQ